MTTFLDKDGLEYFAGKLDERYLSSSSGAKNIIKSSTDIDCRYLYNGNIYLVTDNIKLRLITTFFANSDGSPSTIVNIPYDEINLTKGTKIISYFNGKEDGRYPEEAHQYIRIITPNSDVTYVSTSSNPSTLGRVTSYDVAWEIIDNLVGGNTVYVTDEKPETANEGDLYIGEGIEILGSEVVNSLDGDETNKAPSVSAVKTGLSNISYNNLKDKPSLSTVATSGSYSDLSNTPALKTVATSGSYNDLTNKPSLATVATSGSYNDLSNKPSLKTVATSGSYSDLSNKPTIPGISTASSTSTTNAYSCSYLNSKLVDSSGTNWIRYADGTQICWGEATGTTTMTDWWSFANRSPEGSSSVSYTFPKTFKTAPNVTVSPKHAYTIFGVALGDITVSSFTFTFFKVKQITDGAYGINYIAIGKWK